MTAAGFLALAAALMLATTYQSLWSVVFVADVAGLVAAVFALRYPSCWFVVGIAFTVVGLAHQDGSAATFLLMFLALLDLNSRRPRWRGIVLLVVAVGIFTAARFGRPLLETALFDLSFVMMAMVGGTLRVYQEQAKLVMELAHAQRRNERIDRARDMHDVVASSMSQVSLTAHSLLASMPADSPAGVREGLERIAGEAGRSLTELRGVLRLMRDGDDGTSEHATQQVIDEWIRAVSSLRALGFDLKEDYDIAGAGPLEASRGRCVAMTIRELAANIARHARPKSAVRMTLKGNSTSVLVVASNPVAPPTEASPLPSSGFGLGGLRDRIHALSGRLDVKDIDGEWFVAAQIPSREPQTVPPRRQRRDHG
ncbi:MAG: histidine kinase [Propionibacteriaceae bacterium]|nr:histidine kinase [Propionibacteriaceae bacterium]